MKTNAIPGRRDRMIRANDRRVKTRDGQIPRPPVKTEEPNNQPRKKPNGEKR